MYLTSFAIDDAVGHILRHNIADLDGRKLLSKGHRIRAGDLPRLRELGIESVRVAVLEAGDVHEDDAARRLAAAVSGSGIIVQPPAASRVNLLAAADGVVEIDVAALRQINQIDGLTIATLRSHALVRARKRVATIKIIPFAVREEQLAAAEAIGATSSAVVAVRPLQPLAVAVVLVGSALAQRRIEHNLYPPIDARVSELGATLHDMRYVAPDEASVAEGLVAARAAGVGLVIIAGETSIMDRDDVTPTAIRMAGGRVEHYGAPVEPGNLLLLAYFEEPGAVPLPVLGAPGCVRSRDINIVDLILPRLLAGEVVTRDEIVELGHGGLLS